MLLMISVDPTCADFMKTTVDISGSQAASITPRRYSTRDVLHLPGSALASADRMRNWSAHWLIVRSGGGRSTVAADRRTLSITPYDSGEIKAGEFVEGLPYQFAQDLFAGGIARTPFKPRNGFPRGGIDARAET